MAVKPQAPTEKLPPYDTDMGVMEVKFMKNRKAKMVQTICPQCGKSRSVRQGREGTKCWPCYLSRGVGANRKTEILVHGYIWVWRPDHPNAQKGYVKRSHLVMEQSIGRYLRRGEDVHHENEIKADDRIKNLKLLSHAEHAALTNRLMKKAAHMITFRWPAREVQS